MRGCGVSRRYIDVCYCDMFSVVNVYLDHLKFYVVCINSRRYVCCSECDVVSNDNDNEMKYFILTEKQCNIINQKCIKLKYCHGDHIKTNKIFDSI